MITEIITLNYSHLLQDLTINPPLPLTIANLMAHLPPKYNKLDDQKQSIQHRFISWKLWLIFSPMALLFLSLFKDKLGEPEEMGAHRTTKTKQVPLRASKTGPSTPAKNATVMGRSFFGSLI